MSDARVGGYRRVRSVAEKLAIISSQAASGKTIGRFCREAGIAISSFHNWRRTLSASQPARENPAPLFIELTTPSVPQPPVPIRVVLASGDSIEASVDSSPEWLARFARLLKGESC